MSVESDGRGRLKQLTVNGAKNPNIVIRSSGRANDAIVLIDHLHELADDEWNRLDPLDLLLGAKELTLEVLMLILNILFLDVDELELSLEGLQATI